MESNNLPQTHMSSDKTEYRAGDTGVGRYHFPVKVKDVSSIDIVSDPFFAFGEKNKSEKGLSLSVCNSSAEYSVSLEERGRVIEPALRDGDTGVGRRHFPIRVIDGNGVDSLSVSNLDKRNFQEDYSFSNDSLFTLIIPRWVQKFLWYSLFLVAAIAVFKISVDMASFLENLRHLSLWKQIVLFIPVILFFIAIVIVTIKISILFYSFRKTPEIKQKALRDLELRRHMRNEASASAVAHAVDILKDFLRESLVIQRDKLLSLGCDEATVDELEANRRRLIDEGDKYSSQDWINEFRQTIETPLDEISKKRIRHYAIQAGIRSGISPVPILDRLIVLLACLAMIKDLMEIYGLRSSWSSNLTLATLIVSNAYLAGILQNATEVGVETLIDSIPAEEATTHFLGGFAKKVGKIFGSKAAESLAQGVIVDRLGKVAMKTLQPLSN